MRMEFRKNQSNVRKSLRNRKLSLKVAGVFEGGDRSMRSLNSSQSYFRTFSSSLKRQVACAVAKARLGEPELILVPWGCSNWPPSTILQ